MVNIPPTLSSKTLSLRGLLRSLAITPTAQTLTAPATFPALDAAAALPSPSILLHSATNTKMLPALEPELVEERPSISFEEKGATLKANVQLYRRQRQEADHREGEAYELLYAFAKRQKVQARAIVPKDFHERVRDALDRFPPPPAEGRIAVGDQAGMKKRCIAL